MKKEESRASLSEFRSIKAYIKPYIPKYIAGLLALLIVDAAQILIPQYIRKAVDLLASGEATITAILVIAGFLLLTAACISLGRFLWRFFIHGSSRRIEAALRKNLFDHIISRDMYFFNGNTTGDLMARSTSDLNHVRMAIGMGVVAFVDGTVMAISILSVMFIQQPFLAALVVLPLPVITFLILRFGSLLGKRFQRAQEAFSNLGQIVQETFSGIRLVKAYVQEQWFEKRFAQSNDEYKQANMAVVKIFGLFFPLITFLSGIGSAVLLLVGSRMVLSGSLSAGEMVAMFSYLQMLVWPIMGAGFTINTFQRGAVSLKRVNEIFKTENLIQDNGDVNSDIATVQKAPLIEFRDADFSYPDGTQVLQDISFTLHKGEILGILGRTGSGKSTLLKLFTRLVESKPGNRFF
jgi:ATP-binding cassette, subfamily B, multidrug efflux pump